MPEFTWFNLQTGNVAKTNEDWLWISNDPDSCPPEDIVVELACDERDEYEGWVQAQVFIEDTEELQIHISEEDFERFLLVTNEVNRGWNITEAETGKPASYDIYVSAIAASADLYKQKHRFHPPNQIGLILSLHLQS